MPVDRVRFREPRVEATWIGMLVPEASVDKNDLHASGKNQVWLAWQVFAMKPEAVAEFVNRGPDGHFRLRATRAYRRHVGATALP